MKDVGPPELCVPAKNFRTFSRHGATDGHEADERLGKRTTGDRHVAQDQIRFQPSFHHHCRSRHAGTVEQSAAKKFSNGEVAAIAGIGGFILGATIANGNRGPGYYGHYSSWERHVDRCYARYNTYDHRTDTFVGYDGYEHRCRL